MSPLNLLQQLLVLSLLKHIALFGSTSKPSQIFSNLRKQFDHVHFVL
jgi:hypothetical protein